MDRSGATAWEIGKMQRWRWEELVCGNLKVGRERLGESLVDAGNWGGLLNQNFDICGNRK